MQLEAAVQACCSRYLPKPGPLHSQAKMHLVLSHRRRIRLNTDCQEDTVAEYRAANPEGLVVFIQPSGDGECLNRAQPFELCKGTRLIGANRETRGSPTAAF